MTYIRRFDLDTGELGVFPPNDKITLYGKKYKICSMDLKGTSIGIVLTEEEMVKFLTRAKANGHRWKAKVQNTVDGRRVFQALAYRASLN